MAASVLFRIDQNRQIQVEDPAPDVVVDTDGQTHAKTGTFTHAGEDLVFGRRGSNRLRPPIPNRTPTTAHPPDPHSQTPNTQRLVSGGNTPMRETNRYPCDAAGITASNLRSNALETELGVANRRSSRSCRKLCRFRLLARAVDLRQNPRSVAF